MSQRFALHLIALLALLTLGIWFIYQSAYQNSLAGLFTAVYWFGYLIYVLIACIFFLLLRKRSARALIMAHAFSGCIAILAAVIMVQLGEQYHAENNAVTTLDPQGAQDLKIPVRKEQPY